LFSNDNLAKTKANGARKIKRG